MPGSMSIMSRALLLCLLPAVLAIRLSPAQEEAVEALQLAVIEAQGPATEGPAAEIAPLLPVGAQQLGKPIKLRLKPASGVPPSTKTYAVIKYWPLENRLVWKVTVFNIAGYTGVHLHVDSKGTYNGPIAAFLNPASVPFFKEPKDYAARTHSGVISDGDFAPGFKGNYATFLKLLQDGAVYVNVHTAEYPAGVVQAYLKAP